MYSDYQHASIKKQRAEYGALPAQPNAWIIWLSGKNMSASQWHDMQSSCEMAMPWLKWSFPLEATSALDLTPPLRFIRPNGSACVEPPGLASAMSAVHAMLAQAEAMGFRSDRIVLGGFGQGGALALSAGRAYDKPLAGIAAFSGWCAGMCTASEANAATPVLLCHGTADGTAAHCLMRESAELLRMQHATTPVTEHSIPGLGHSSCASEHAVLRKFLAQRLPGSGAPSAMTGTEGTRTRTACPNTNGE